MENIEILNIGKEIVHSELVEIQNLASNLGYDFVKAVALIKNCQGKIVVIGVGKNAPIAQKMVATMNSTGTKSQFLHAGEATHGDLGLLNKEDVCLLLSKSGNTAEIKTSFPSIKELSNATIGITGNLDSFLAKNCDIVLDTTIEKEAGVNNLAPTSSTTVQLVLCDALAMTVMQLKGFTSDDFGRYHPGGSLGKQLLLKVEDMIDPDQKPEIDVEANIKEVIQSLSSGRFGITVVKEKDEIVGVVTDGDLRRMLEKHSDLTNLTARDIATFNPKTIHKDVLAKEALRIINQYAIGQLVVVDDNKKYVGIIDFHGLTKEGISAE